MNNKLYIACMVFVTVLAIIGLFVLPPTVVLQIDAFGGAGTTASKYMALSIPLVLTYGGAIWSMKSPAMERRRGLIVTITGVVVILFTFAVNLF